MSVQSAQQQSESDYSAVNYESLRGLNQPPT